MAGLKVGKVVACTAVLLTGGCLVCLGWLLLRSHREFYREVEGFEALRMTLDLGSAGEYRGAFKQRFKPEHGKQLRLMVRPPFTGSGEVQDALRGLRAHLEIYSPAGESILEAEIDGESFSFPKKNSYGCGDFTELPPHTPYLFFNLWAAGFERCALVLRVDSPAEGMMGRSQELVSKNVYCRLPAESAPLFMKLGMGVGGVLLVVGTRWGRSLLRRG